MMLRSICLSLALATCSVSAGAQPWEGETLYRVVLAQASPGDYAEVMADWSARIGNWPERDPSKPMWMRHSQGDWWDFMFIFPVDESESIANSPANVFGEDPRISRAEDLWVVGAGIDVLRGAMEGASLYHIEMFRALPGMRDDLMAQRRMENEYLIRIDRPQNFIMRRVAGIAIDAFTLGCHPDLEQFAVSGQVSSQVDDAAARAAGFAGVSDISPWLRSLIAKHHDTLAVAIR
ncbi:MAG: hypothetical protein ACI9W4_000942 [Rhodothermales bacterium]|jgi:hypothetical protein